MHLIVGGSGFIARHLAVDLAAAEKSVLLLSRSKPTWLEIMAPPLPIRWRYWDTKFKNWMELLEGVETIYYHAWSSLPATANDNPSADWMLNVQPLIELLKALVDWPGQRPRLVFTSSGGSVYGRPQALPLHEDHPLHPLTAYGAGKVSAEAYISFYRDFYGLDCRVARIANPYGPYQDSRKGQGAVASFFAAARESRPIDVWGEGGVIRDFIHVSDVSRALKLLGTADICCHHIFNIGSGVGLSILELAKAIEHIVGTQLNLVHHPARHFDVQENILSIERAKAHLAWQPTIPLSSGLGDYYKYLLRNC